MPTKILLDRAVTKVIAEAENGYFCLLPRHIDFVATLVPGILSFQPPDGSEAFLAVDEGVLVKCGLDVFVSTRHAVQSDDLRLLKQTVDTQFRVLNEQEQKTRSVLAKLEAHIIRQFVELDAHG